MKKNTVKIKRTNPELCEECKKDAVHSLGKFSARAMQRAVVLYKERGGEYEGTKDATNSLTLWNAKQTKKLKTVTDIL
jgi:hypothetical protein